MIAIPMKKTERQRTYQSRATRLTPPRVHLTPPRGSRRRRRVSSSPALVPGVIAPQAITDPSAPIARAQAPVGDALQLYLREIGQVQLLTPTEEIELARRIKRGDKRAREHMIKANLRLVVKIARDYDGLGLPLLDLINEGNIGLMKGVERFRPG